MKQFLFVFLGGGLGSMVRFGVSLLIQQFGKPVLFVSSLMASIKC